MALRTLYQTLLDSDVARLRVIARQWEIALQAERRADLAAELADAMARVEAVGRAWSLLPEAERAALEDLLRRGGALPWATFVRRWGQIRAVGPGRLEREALWRDPISPAEGLWYWGFIQRAFEERSTGKVEMAFVPEELRLYIPAPTPLAAPPPEPAAPPVHQTAAGDTFADDLVTFWAALQTEALRPAPSSQREALLQQISPPAEPRLALLDALAPEQDWVRADERGLLRPAPEPMLAWLQADLWTQWAALGRAWMESRCWNDLAAVPTLRSDPAAGWPNDPLAARQGILDMVRRCTPGVWYALEAFVVYVREHATDFLRPDGDYDAWALRDALTDAPLRGFDAWDAVEGALVAFVVAGPMAWLGLVDLGHAVPALPAGAFRLTGAGAALLGLGDPPDLTEPPPVQLQMDGTLVVPARRRYERFQLSRVARLSGWGKAYTYRLTPSSLARARQQRISVERIGAFLEAAIGRELPAHLRTAIERAYRAGETVRLEHVWLLRTRDPALRDLPVLRRFVQEQVGPDAVLIRTEDRLQVLALLTKEGILPEFESDVKPETRD